MTILDRIVQTKRKEVELAKRQRSKAELRAAIDRVDRPRDFFAAVTAQSPDGINLIAEIKRRSPSAGLIVEDFDPGRIARTYDECGAAALSVLTDETYFGGNLTHLVDVKRSVPLPVLRKDFIVDEYQVYESRAAGADAILLIVEAIGVSRVVELLCVARRLGMSVLVEVHSGANLEALLDTAGPPGDGYLLGINNRDLAAQRTDLSTTTRLAALLPPATAFLAESGIATRNDVLAIRKAGACAILVGESLLRADDISAKIDDLLGRH